MLDVLDELIGPLSAHINGILAQPVTGTDDQVTHVDTKKAYLALLNSIVASKLHTVLISERESLIVERSKAFLNREIREQRAIGGSPH